MGLRSSRLHWQRVTGKGGDGGSSKKEKGKRSMCELMSLGDFIIRETGEFERFCHTGGILSEREGGRETKVVFFFS